MTQEELLAVLQVRSKKTEEFAEHQKTTLELFDFLGNNLTSEQIKEVSVFIDAFGRSAGNLGQKMLKMADDLVESQ